MLEILKRSRFLFVGGGGFVCATKKCGCVCVTKLYDISFAIIQSPIIFCNFVCGTKNHLCNYLLLYMCLPLIPSCCNQPLVYRKDRWICICPIVKYSRTTAEIVEKKCSVCMYHEKQIKKISRPHLFIRKLKTCFKFLLDQGT